MIRSLAVLIFAAPIAIAAQSNTPADSARARRVKIQTDSLRKETCRNGVLSASGLTCTSQGSNPAPRVSVLRRLANRIDSIENAAIHTPAPPVNAKPVAAFSYTIAGGIVTFNASASTDDKGIVAYEWRSFDTVNTDRPTLFGVQITRGVSASPGWPERLVVRDSAGRADTLTKTIVTGYTPPPPVDTTPPPVDTTTPPPSAGQIFGAWLPKAIPERKDPYPGKPCTVTITPPMAINPALAAARGGDVVCLGKFTYPAGIVLPARALGDTGWRVFRAAQLVTPEGTRVRRSHVMSPAGLEMPLVRLSAPSQIGMSTAASADHWYVAGIAFHTSALSYAVIQLGASPQTAGQTPHSLTLSRILTFADSVPVRRCVSLHSASTAIVDSWLGDCHEKGSDSQAIWGGNGPGPYLIDNNHLEGAGENIMFGGGDPSIFGLVPSDITITRNHIFTPPAWRGNGIVTPWTKKNLLELKNAVRVRIEANVFDGSWGDGQSGAAILAWSVNQSGACRWCRTTDVILRRNLIRNVSSGLNAGGVQAPVDSIPARIVSTENVYEIGAYAGDRRGLQWATGRDFVSSRDLIVGNISATLYLVGGTRPCELLDGAFTSGQYGVKADAVNSGTASLNAACGSSAWTWTGMQMIGPSSPTYYPAGTLFPASEAASALAASIRQVVNAATAPVVVPP